MSALSQYADAIRKALEATLTVRSFPSEIIEKQSKPEVELQGYNSRTRALCSQPLYICRSDKEKCLIESSVNSVRVSFTIKSMDDLDRLISDKFGRYMAVRADYFEILRRKPVPGYDLSFLIMDSHLEKYETSKIINFIIDYVNTIDKDLSVIKLNIIAQTRITATCFVNAIANN